MLLVKVKDDNDVVDEDRLLGENRIYYRVCEGDYCGSSRRLTTGTVFS